MAKPIDPAKRMIANKKKLIQRLHHEIRQVRADAAAKIQTIKFRIRQANVILTALEKGTLR